MREPVSQAQPHGSVTASATHSGGNRRSLWVSMAIAFVAVMILEVGFFNLGHWRTSRLQAATVGDAIIGEGLKSLGHHEYEITDPETATITVPVGARDSGAPVRIGSVRVQATPGNTNEVPNQRNHYSRAAIQLNTTGGQTISGNTWVDSRDSDGVWEDRLNILDYTTNPASQYLIFGKKLQYYDSHEIRVRYLGDKGDFVLFDSIHANPVIPFEINPWRLLVELAFAAFFVLFRPRSGIYRMRVDERRVRQNLAIAGYVVAWSAIIVAIARFAMPKPSGLNTGFMHWVDYEQYQRLADALIHGHTWLDLKVDPALTTMANPYDYFARRSIAADGTHTFYWDHAYYNGHYYCYFGVVPALLTFVPFQLVTGHWMPTWAAMGVFTTLAVVFGTLLVRRLARDYFPKASLGVVWLVIIGFNVATNLFVYVYSPNFYGMPINCSIAVTLVGLWFWQVSKRPDGTVNPWLIAAGSLCMALNFGSRPQFMAAWLLAFPLFWPQFTKLRTLFSRKGLAPTIAAFVPFALVIPPLLAYNYVRFGSLFDFGQNYNLTGFDMTTRSSSPYTVLPDLFNQWFQPVDTAMRFPFIMQVDTTMAGPNEPSIGGYFAIYPLALFALLFVLVRRQLRAHGVWAMTVMMMALTAVVALFDCYKCGTAMRYYGDFAYLVMLSALFVVLAYATAAQHRPAVNLHAKGFSVNRFLGFRTLQTMLVTLVFLTLLINLFGLFNENRLDAWHGTFSGTYTTVRSWFIGLTA